MAITFATQATRSDEGFPVESCTETQNKLSPFFDKAEQSKEGIKVKTPK